MIPYYLLVLSPILISLLYPVKENNKRRRNAIIISVFFAIFLALLIFRSESVGIDNKNYKHMFEMYKNVKLDKVFDYSTEGGYILINKLARFIYDDYRTVIVLVALISLIPVAIMYIKESESPSLTVAVFMAVAPFSMYFSGLRQVVAISFGVLAYYCTKNKKLILFVITVLIATLFHQSAVVLFFMYPIYHLKIDHKKLIFTIPVAVVVYIFNEPLLRYIQTYFDEKYQYEITQTGAITMILVIAVLLLVCYWIPNESELDEQTRGLRSILFFVLLIQCFAPINSVAMRMNYYYLILVPILIPRILNRSKYKYGQIAKLIGVAMTVLFVADYFYGAHTGTDILQLYPYEFLWK